MGDLLNLICIVNEDFTSDEFKCFQHQQPVKTYSSWVVMPSDTHSGLHTWAQIVWMTTLKKTKRTPYGFHQHCSTSLDTYLAFSLQRPFVERAYFSAGVDICRENESLHMRTAQRAPALCAIDEWGTRPLIYLNLQQHSWLKWSRSPANGGIQCRTVPCSPGVESLDQRRGSGDIVGWNSSSSLSGPLE